MSSPTSASTDGFDAPASAPSLPIGLIAAIVVLAIIAILLLLSIGHTFWSRSRARRRGEDPGPLFTSWSCNCLRRNNRGGQDQEGQNLNTPIEGTMSARDARGREFYNVAESSVNTNDTLKGGAIELARYA